MRLTEQYRCLGCGGGLKARARREGRPRGLRRWAWLARGSARLGRHETLALLWHIMACVCERGKEVAAKLHVLFWRERFLWGNLGGGKRHALLG